MLLEYSTNGSIAWFGIPENTITMIINMYRSLNCVENLPRSSSPAKYSNCDSQTLLLIAKQNMKRT